MSKPTREQIENATPEQLRIWCAEMMGWRCVRYPIYIYPEGVPVLHYRAKFLPPDISLAPDGTMEFVDLDDAPLLSKTSIDLLPPFPTDIAAAWQIADKLTSTTKQTFRLEMYCTGCTATFETAGLGSLDGEWAYDDQDAPLAICRAALLWWIEQPETV
jgi:hypothetical protein